MGLGQLLIVTLTLICTGLQASRATDATDWGYWGENGEVKQKESAAPPIESENRSLTTFPLTQAFSEQVFWTADSLCKVHFVPQNEQVLGPQNWPGICTTGKKQSPIDIVTEDAIRIDLGALKFDRYDYAFIGTLTNTGHSVQIQLDGVPIYLSGGSLSSIYVLEQMHFHWNAEHTVDGSRDPLELHFVHYDIRYENFSVAAEHENGIVVVAVLFELSNYDDNLDLLPILKATEMVSNWVGKSMMEIKRKVIPYLFLPKDHTTYYRYQGSLTTPGCQESVMWFVMTEKLTVSEAQVNVFKHLETSNGTLKLNYRPTQDIGDRKVYHRLEGYSGASSSTSNIISCILSVVLVRLLYTSEDL